jgi:hypothetical protein
MGWRPNERGTCPLDAQGKRVKVRLRNGVVTGESPVVTGGKAGWPADRAAAGSGQPMNWELTGSPFDVLEWDFV